MPSLYAEIDINAPQSVVWEALLRKDQWRYWNTFLYDCDPGMRIARGSEIFLAMQRLEGDEETEFQPLITMIRPPNMLRWVSTIPGLRTEHIFELRENVPGRTHYIHRELFSGILSKVFLPFIRQDERQGIRRMSQQLKMYVEQSVLGNTYPPERSRYDDRSPGYASYDSRPYSRQPQYGDRPYNDRPYSEQPYGDETYRDRSYDRRYDDQYRDGQYRDGAYDQRQYQDRPYNDYPDDRRYDSGRRYDDPQQDYPRYNNPQDYPQDYDSRDYDPRDYDSQDYGDRPRRRR
ncbi:MAG: hypothetical protein AAFP20_18345 [Cyanobacteria bacterium J06614_10]